MELLGLENRRTVEVLAELVRRKAPTILFLMETKLNVREMEPIKTELGFQSMKDCICIVCFDKARDAIAILPYLLISIDRLQPCLFIMC